MRLAAQFTQGVWGMGLDLVARSDAVESFHVNRFFSGVLNDLLVELGCDVSLLSDSNESGVVDADTARRWGAAIQEQVDDIFVMEFPDKAFEGGMRIELHVAGTQTPVMISSHLESENALAQAIGRAVEEPGTPERTVPLRDRPTERAYVLRFARFCEESGGFTRN